MKIRRKQNV